MTFTRVGRLALRKYTKKKIKKKKKLTHVGLLRPDERDITVKPAGRLVSTGRHRFGISGKHRGCCRPPRNYARRVHIRLRFTPVTYVPLIPFRLESGTHHLIQTANSISMVSRRIQVLGHL